MLGILGFFVLPVPIIILILWLVNLFTKRRSSSTDSASNATSILSIEPTQQAGRRLKGFFGSIGLSILYFFVIFYLNVLCQPDKLGEAGTLGFLIYTLFFTFVIFFIFLFILLSQRKDKAAIIFTIFVISFYILFILIYMGKFYNGSGIG